MSRRSVTRGWLVFILGSLAAFAPLSIDMYLPAFPRIAADFDVEVGRVQLTLSVFLVGVALGQALCGPITDRWGRRGPLLAGLGLFTLATVGCALAPSIGSLTLFRFVMALGGAAGMVISRTVVRDLFDERESAQVYSLLMLVMGVAPILAPVVGGQLLLISGWRSLFWVIAACSALCALAVFKLLPETLPASGRVRHGPRRILGTYAGLFRNRVFIGYVLAVSCASGVLFAYIAGSPAMFIGVHGVSEQAFGIFFGANAAGLILASQFNRVLLRRFTAQQILRTTYALNAVCVLLLLAQVMTGWGGFPAVVGLLGVSVALTGLIFPNGTALAMAPVGEVAGSASALMGTLQFAVGGVAASLVGALHDGTGRSMAGMIAVAGVTGWVILRSLTRTRGVGG